MIVKTTNSDEEKRRVNIAFVHLLWWVFFFGRSSGSISYKKEINVSMLRQTLAIIVSNTFVDRVREEKVEPTAGE